MYFQAGSGFNFQRISLPVAVRDTFTGSFLPLRLFLIVNSKNHTGGGHVKTDILKSYTKKNSGLEF